MRANIFLTGFSATGKTVVGRRVARLLGWRFVDLDEEVARRAGRSIPDIFEEQGEARFRELEHESLESACRDDGQVVSTGGGIASSRRNRRLMEGCGLVVCLDARPETIHARLSDQGKRRRGRTGRPMLDGPDPLARIVALKSERQAGYALAHWTVHTDEMAPPEAADEVARAWKMLGRGSASAAPKQSEDLAATVRTSSGEYPVWVGWGGLDGLGDRVRGLLSPGVAYVVTDENVRRHAWRAQVSLEAVGIPCHLFVIPPGEQSKSLETAQHLYAWLAGRKAERGHLLVAVGGGVVGDLTGFVAATFLRGISYAQAPTTLLAMMDAAIGGKTGVDLPQGKNMVGAFHQPRFVLEDVGTLESMPQREMRSGWAEAIKHGLILDEPLLRSFEEERDAVVALERRASMDVIRRSVAVKARVVTRDEKETMGVRVLLNYGHTIAHAIEAVTGYGLFLHGEAVSVGMMGAARISERLGMLTAAEVDRQRSVLEAYGLPISWDQIDPATVIEAMAVDKKTAGGTIRWVLLDGIGRAVTRSDVPRDVVLAAIRSLQGRDSG